MLATPIRLQNCLTKNLEALSCTNSPRAGCRGIIKVASIPFVVHN